MSNSVYLRCNNKMYLNRTFYKVLWETSRKLLQNKRSTVEPNKEAKSKEKLNQEGTQNVKHKMSTFIITGKMNKSDQTAQKKSNANKKRNKGII